MRNFYLFMAAIFAAMTWSVNAQADEMTSEQTNSDYFDFSAINVQLWDPDKTNSMSYNQTTGAYDVTFANYTQAGWEYTNAADFSKYKYLVVELSEASTCGTQVRIWDGTNDNYTLTELGSETQLVIDLTTEPKKLSSNDATEAGETLDLDNITKVAFWSYKGTVSFKSVYLATEDYISAQDYTKVFSLNDNDIKTDIYNGNGANTYSNGTITFGGIYNCVGWYNSDGWDLSGYDKLVVKFSPKVSGQFRIYDYNGYDDNYVYAVGFETSTTEIDVDLTSITHTTEKIGETPNDNYGKSIDLGNIYYVCFWSYGAGDVEIESITLYKKVTIDGYYFATVTPYTGTLDFTGTGITPYVATATDGTYYLVEKQQLAAGEGALLYSTSASGGVYVPESESYVATTSGNAFVGVTPDDCDSTDESYGPYVTLTASAVDDTNISGTNYILSVESEGIGFYKANTNKVAAGNAYLQLPTGTSAGSIKFGIIGVEGEDDETTGITEVETSTTSASNAIYSIGGVRRSQLQKGINIVGGKKVIVK